MLRVPNSMLAALVLAPAVFGQAQIPDARHVITAPIKHGGTYHLAQGIWTRLGQQSLAGGLDVVYDNTCFSGGYHAGMSPLQVWTDDGRVPGPTTPDTSTTKPGCALAYRIEGFSIGYCTSTTPTQIDVAFRESYFPCGSIEDFAVTASYQLTGLPSTTMIGTQACWLINVDLSGTPSLPDRSFVMASDGGSLGGPVTFGWSFQMPTASTASTDGLMLRGDPALCSFWDGTIWDPVPADEDGTGMGNLDQFRVDGPTSGTIVPGCYFFGGDPYAGFLLELYADRACAPAPGLDFCAGDGSGTPCPCANNSSAGANQGCRNTTGVGASLDSLGAPSVGDDTLALRVSNLPAASFVLFLQGTGQINGGSGSVFGDGLSCVGGSTNRLMTRMAENGGAFVPEPGEPKLSTLGGVPAGGGVTRYYQALYRDAADFCTPGTFNFSNGHEIVWVP